MWTLKIILTVFNIFQSWSKLYPPFIDCQRAHSELFIEEMEPRRDWELQRKCGLANAIPLGKGHICTRFGGSTVRNSRRQSNGHAP